MTEETHPTQEPTGSAERLDAFGQLAGGIAGEFANVLHVVLACADALRIDAAAGVPAAPEDVAELRAAAERGRDLTRQLLAVARRQALQPAVTDLNEVVRGSERLLRRIAGPSVHVRLALQPGLWRVRCERGQMEQVLANLAARARHAFSGPGTLTVETTNVETSGGAVAAGSYVSLVVRDNAPTLSREALARVFEPFSPEAEPGSPGLGLAVVHGIVRQSGGAIHVESPPGTGTAFEILLPRAREGVVETPAPAGGPGAVLLAEDDPHLRELIGATIAGAGFRVVQAGSGADALEMDARALEGVRLLVTDLSMPGMDGRALADAMRIRNPGLRVLLVSGSDAETLVHRGVLDESIQFLAKPFRGADLLARVRAILDAPDPPALRGAGGVALWRPELATGIREVDLQHRELLVNVASLLEAVRTGRLGGADDALAYLERYAVEHFATEERLMREFAWSGREAHVALHRSFAAELAQRQADYAGDHSRAALLLDLARWMESWLPEHVMRADADMARYLRAAAAAYPARVPA